MPTSEPVNLNQKRQSRSQHAELEQATKQLMSALVRTFQAQQAIQQNKVTRTGGPHDDT